MARWLKDPEATLDYAWDWSAWLEAGETIDDYTITVPAALTLVSDSEAAGVVTVWLSGGIDNAIYKAACRIETSLNRIDVRRIIFRMEER